MHGCTRPSSFPGPATFALTLLVGACADDDDATGGATASTTGATTTTTSGPLTTGGSSPTSSTTAETTTDTGDDPETPPTISRGMTDDLAEFPQYLAVRKSPTEGVDPGEQPRCEALLPALVGLPFVGNKNTCVVFSAYVLDVIPDAAVRRQVFTQGFEEVRVMVGAEQIGDRRLAVEIAVSLLDDTPERVETYLADLLFAARAARMPVLINLDAVNWWGGRPDLWNFFDPQKPGYDPTSVDNVEWTAPTPDAATRVFWRNWGAQIRVETPIPNYGGPRYRAAIHDVLGRLTPHIRGFIDGLAPDERYFYAGTIVGTELAVGVNHYHYPNGNSVLGAPVECDPGLPLAPGCPGGGDPCAAYNHGVCPPNFADSLSGGVAQVGYHAALDLGLITADQPMTQGSTTTSSAAISRSSTPSCRAPASRARRSIHTPAACSAAAARNLCSPRRPAP